MAMRLHGGGMKTFITGYAALFHVPDNDKDIIRQGAFKFMKPSSEIPMTWQGFAVIGRWLSIKEDHLGLHVFGLIDLRRPFSKDVCQAIETQQADGLAVQFYGLKQHRNPAPGTRTISLIDLRSISICREPTQPLARCMMVRG